MKTTIAFLLPLFAAALATAAEVGQQVSIPSASIQCTNERFTSPGGGGRCHYCYRIDEDDISSARITVRAAVDNVPQFSGHYTSCAALYQLIGGAATVNAIVTEKTEKLFGRATSTTLQIQLVPPFGPSLIGLSQ